MVVCAGFLQETALKKAGCQEFTDTKFVFVDGYEIGLSNVAPISFKEEQSGYLAGYAVVKDGFTKLGFCGRRRRHQPRVLPFRLRLCRRAPNAAATGNGHKR